MSSNKLVHSIILDAGPLLSNDPSISTLLATSKQLYTVPLVVSEIRDNDARSRVETTVVPFLTIRCPSPESIKVVKDFASKTGDIAVLSKADIDILALAYEIECERNHGDWRLRKMPGQTHLNGPPPSTNEDMPVDPTKSVFPILDSKCHSLGVPSCANVQAETKCREAAEAVTASCGLPSEIPDVLSGKIPAGEAVEAVEAVEVNESSIRLPNTSDIDGITGNATSLHAESSDSEGWITPSNLRRHQAKDQNASPLSSGTPSTIQVATVTFDFAMQNVLLQMNLNVLSTSMHRIRHLRTYILRCHACFATTKDMNRQFCFRCGKPTLTRVTCSTNKNGEFKIHLKKNMQWNTRGDKFSIPKPVSGSANGKVRGKAGGKGGWGQELILTEDQKEYTNAVGIARREKEKNLMDEDFLPGILTGERGKAGGRPKIGGGRNINSRKR